MAQVFAVLMFEDDSLPAGHVLYPLGYGGVVPPGVCPPAVDAAGCGPVAFVGDDYTRVVAPGVAVHGVGIAVEACFQVFEVGGYVTDGGRRRCFAGGSAQRNSARFARSGPSQRFLRPCSARTCLRRAPPPARVRGWTRPLGGAACFRFCSVRVGPQTVPGLLKGCVVRAEVQAVLLTHEGEAVGGSVAGVLQVVLAELLGRRHIEGTGADVGYRSYRIVENLPSGVCGKQFVSFRQLKVADKGILQLAYDGVWLAVLHRRSEPHHLAFGPNFQVQSERLSVQTVIIETYRVAAGCNGRYAVCRPYLYLLAVGCIVVQPPQTGSAGVIMSSESEFP